MGLCGIIPQCEPNDPIADSPERSTETPDPVDETDRPIQIDFMKIVTTDGPASLIDTPPSTDSGMHSWGEQWENMSISTADTEAEQNVTDHPGLLASVDRCPNPSIETLNSHRS